VNVVAVIQADLATGAQGLPSLLAEDLCGKPVLARTVGRVAAAELPAKTIVMAETDEEKPRVAELLDGAKADVWAVKGPDLVQRGAIRRSRCWSRNGWRGGITGTTVFDEEGTPAKLLAMAKSTGADAVLKVSPAAALVRPETIDDVIRWAEKHSAESHFYFTDLPPGMAVELYRVSMLEQLTRVNGTIHLGLIYQPEKSERDPAETKGCLRTDDLLRLTPFRLSADSPRTLDRLRAIYAEDSAESVRRLKSTPSLWPGAGPEEIEFELASPGRVDDPYAALSGAAEMKEFMDLDRFAAAAGELAAMGDVNVTFGGFGEPLAHPRFFDFVAAARRAGACGLHVATSGRPLNDEMVERLAASDLDAISVRLFAHTEETYERLTGRRDLERITALVKKLFARRKELRRTTPFVIPEMFKSRDTVGEMEAFFDDWFRASDWVVIRGWNDFAGQVEDRSVLHPYPRRRGMCMQLMRRLNVAASGDALVCGQDFRRTRALGNVFEKGIAAVWRSQSLEALRAGHAAGDFSGFDLCRKCNDWFHL
jgi:spiro-SPASM protein